MRHLWIVLCVGLLAGCTKPASMAADAGQVPPAQTDAVGAAPVAADPGTAEAPGVQIAQQPGGTPPPPGGAGADWPQFRGPQANGISPETGINKNWAQKPPRELWRTSMSDDGYASPTIVGGRVYIVDHQGQNDVVRALNLSNGQDVWTFPYPESGGSNYGWSRSAPSVVGGKVYSVSRSGQVFCLDANSGQKIWSRNFSEFGGRKPQWNWATSPLVDGNLVILQPGGPSASVVALNKDTGQNVWAGGTDPPGYSTPVAATINGVKQYVVFTGKSVIGVNAATGQQLWRQAWETQYDVNAATPLVAGNQVFITSGYGHGCAMVQVGGNGATILWQNKEIQAHFSSPLVLGGFVYGSSDPGVVVCLNPANGQALWKAPGVEKGGICGVDGCLIAVAGNSGAVSLISPSQQGPQELGRMAGLGGQSWTAPVVAQGKLFIRNKQALACYDLR